jgi:hypothetical protein
MAEKRFLLHKIKPVFEHLMIFPKVTFQKIIFPLMKGSSYGKAIVYGRFTFQRKDLALGWNPSSFVK